MGTCGSRPADDKKIQTPTAEVPPRAVEEAARITAAWAAGGAPEEGAWAMHGGRLAKIVTVDPDDGAVAILYADDGAQSDDLEPADVAAAGPAQVAEGEAILADPGLPARRTAAWAAGGAAVRGAWALHGGELGKVGSVHSDDSGNFAVRILYFWRHTINGELQEVSWSDLLRLAAVAAAGPAQVAEGEAMLDALGAGPSLPPGRPPLPLRPRAVGGRIGWLLAAGSPYGAPPTPPPERRAQARTSSRGTSSDRVAARAAASRKRQPRGERLAARPPPIVSRGAGLCPPRPMRHPVIDECA